MGKFKVGDKVRVARGLMEKEREFENGVVDEMVGLEGKVLEIRSVVGDTYYTRTYDLS